MEVVRADEVGAEHGAGYQAGDRGVEAGGGDEEVLAGAVRADAGAGIGEHRDLRVEAGDAVRARLELLDRLGEFAGDGALAGPAVDEHDVRGVVVGGEPAQRVGVDAAAADDGDGVVREVEAVPGLRPAAHEDADEVLALASETSTGLRPGRSARTVSVTVPTARAIRAAEPSRAEWKRSW